MSAAPSPASPWTRGRVLAAALLLASLAHAATAVTHLRRGDSAPAIALPDLDGALQRTEALRGRAVLIVFGELHHERSLEACGEIDRALRSRGLADAAVSVFLVVSERAEPASLRERAGGLGPRITVLHDPGRRAFAAYRVAVMPSAVVVDAEGRVVHAIAGHSDRFADVVTDALLAGTGRLSYARFDEALRAGTRPEDEQAARASRLTDLAAQLEQRDLAALAEEKYLEAIAIAPAHAAARVGLGVLLLRSGRLAPAEEQFRIVLAADADASRAALGLAHVLVLRGGAETADAERICHEVLARHPAEAGAFYMLGLIHEQRHESEEAAASFRKAAELLMSRGARHDTQEPTP